eukprot:13855024-Alexandrium_andersonii.AAC.1
MQIRVPKVPRNARCLRCPPMNNGGSDYCRFRAARRAVLPVGRAGTASSKAMLRDNVSSFDQG